jgi:hypothetical protein
LLNSSTSYYAFYRFQFSGLNAVEGITWTYLKTGSPSGSGLPVVGARTMSFSAVKTGTDPGTNTQVNVDKVIFDAHFEQQNHAADYVQIRSSRASVQEASAEVRAAAVLLTDLLNH